MQHYFVLKFCFHLFYRSQDLENSLLSMNITTIGKLSSLTESVVEKLLPIKPPKVDRLRNALQVSKFIIEISVKFY